MHKAQGENTELQTSVSIVHCIVNKCKEKKNISKVKKASIVLALLFLKIMDSAFAGLKRTGIFCLIIKNSASLMLWCTFVYIGMSNVDICAYLGIWVPNHILHSIAAASSVVRESRFTIQNNQKKVATYEVKNFTKEWSLKRLKKPKWRWKNSIGLLSSQTQHC